jgi:UDP-N-acetylglucosamine enolpyruvyl transferase
MANKAREIQKQVTRPTSVALMLVLFQCFQLAFPNTMNDQWQDFTYNAITVLGATGIIDKLYRNRIKYINFIKNIFTKKEKP